MAVMVTAMDANVHLMMMTAKADKLFLPV